MNNASGTRELQAIHYRIDAMDCPTEEALIRGKLASMPGIRGLEFNLLHRVLTVNHQMEDTQTIAAAIRSLGFEPRMHDPHAPVARAVSPVPARLRLKAWLPLILAGLAALGAEISELAGWWLPWLPAGLAILAVFLGGWTTYRKGWIALVNLNLNINALMSLAVTGALFLRQWPEAAMVMVLFALAEKIEALSLDRARSAIGSLLALSPDQATVRQEDGSWQVMEAGEVPVGSLVRVRPGERFSHDGVVLEGRSAVDQSPVTGESMPVEKGKGDTVFAGTINQEGELVVEVSTEARNSTLSRIIHLVEEAQGNKSATQRFVDRFAGIYTPVVCGLAVLLALVPPLVSGGAWEEWIYRALVMLVIACPCALVISTPVTVVSALTRAASMGIIIKGGLHLEQARKIKWLALDKTGTITRGKPVQTDYIPLSDADLPLRSWALGLASRSDHPVSRALAERGRKDGIPMLEPGAFEALPGRGIRGEYPGQVLYLGNHRLAEELGACTPVLENTLALLESRGKSAVILLADSRALAVFAVTDTIKSTSREAILGLHRLGIRTLMLSGDNQKTARVIADQAGIDEAKGELLPGDKARIIRELAQTGQVVAMAGDGINDAPAIASAGLGIAMGGTGSQAAMETADAVLMDDDLGKINRLVELSRRTVRILVQNICLALGIKAVFMVLTALGYGTLWMAVFADMGASLLVVFNGLRLMGGRPG